MCSFLPVGEQQQQEIEGVWSQLSENEPVSWPSIENKPLNEYQVSYLATMAFPTLFPDGKGDPTNQGLVRYVLPQDQIKHLLKLMVNGYWPELHALFQAGTNSQFGYSTIDVRGQNVINNPHIVDWFFTQRLESLVKHWQNGTGFDMNTKVEVVSIVMVLPNKTTIQVCVNLLRLL